MAENLGEYWWAYVAASILGAFLAPIIGYYRRPRNGQKSSTIHGSAVIDSSLGERIAAALEGLLEIEQTRERQDERRREAERENALRENAAMKRKLDDMKKG